MKRFIGYTAVLCLLAIMVGCGGVTSTGTLAYVANSNGTGFTVFSVNTDGTLTTASISPLPTPQAPQNIVFSPNGIWVFFLDAAGDNIYAYRRSGNGTFAAPVSTSPFPVGPGASSLVVTPNNQFVYVALPNQLGGALAIFSVDQATGILSQVGSNIQVSYPMTQLLISPSGDTLYGLARARQTVLAWSLNTTSGLVTGPATLGVGNDPAFMVLSPKGSYMYVMDHTETTVIANAKSGLPPGPSPDIFALNVSGTTISKMSGLPFHENADLLSGNFPAGPVGGVISSDSRFLYVANQNGFISVFRLSSTTGEPSEVLGSLATVNGVATSTASPFTCGTDCTTPAFINISAQNNALYVLDTTPNANKIYQLAINQSTGQLRSLSPASVGAESATSNPIWITIANFK